jgi:membrane-bound lytic murein transglycosylase D
VPAFIAANYIMTYYSQHNICPMTTRLPAQTDTVMVNRNIHLEQVAEVMGINIDLVRSLNPMYRRDVVPGATELSPIRLPQTETGRFIDLQDSICNYRVDELLGKRTEVEVKDDVPTYYHKSKRYAKRRSARYSKRRSSVSKRRSSASKRRSTGRKRRRR